MVFIRHPSRRRTMVCQRKKKTTLPTICFALSRLETSKRLPSTSSTSSTSSNSTMITNKRVKSKIAASIVTETRTMKKHGNKTTKKRHHHHHHHHHQQQQNDSNNNSTKKPPATSSHLLTHPIIHHQKKSCSQTENIPSINSHHHHRHHHHHVINNDHCDSCGELYGEMISCDTCPATFHLLCANPPLSREDVPKGSYFCENCRAKTVDDHSTTTVLSEPKKKIYTNGLKKNPPRQSTLGQIKIPTGMFSRNS